MIKLSNGHCLEFIAASGALAFDGRGWFWEWPLRWIGLLDPRLFTVVTKTLTLYPRSGNLSKLRPWRVVKFISENGEVIPPPLALVKPSLVKGIVNAVGLTNPGLIQWMITDYPVIQRCGYKVIVSISGRREECLTMIEILNEQEDIVAVEFNASCPNFIEEFFSNPETVVEICLAMVEKSRHPVVLKLGFSQDYRQIAKRTEGKVEAVSINSVDWRVVFPDKESPLAEYGGGGISGQVAQPFTWQMMLTLRRETITPIIGASIWEYEDIGRLQVLGASAYHFGAIFLPYPWRPSMYVKRWRRAKEQGRWTR